MKAGVLHEGKDLGRKANWIVCAGCCIPGIVSGANYCLVPYTCCASESRSCFVCASECSFPCSDDVPLMLTLLCPGLVVYPKCGCCMKVEDVMGPPARAADEVELDRSPSADDAGALSASTPPSRVGGQAAASAGASLADVTDAQAVRFGWLSNYGNGVSKAEGDQRRTRAKMEAVQSFRDDHLINAARLGKPDAVGRAIQSGSSVNCVDEFGCTPLYRAAEFGYVETVRALLEAGADKDLEAKNGNTPIDMVCAGHGVSQDKETKRSIVDLLRAPPARSIRRA